MKKLLYLILLCYTTYSHGQVLFQKSYGGTSVSKVIQTTDSGLIMLATSFDSMIQRSIVLLIKTNAFGDTLWTKTIGNSNNNYAYDVTTADSGNCIVVIGFDSLGNSGSGAFNHLLLIKLNASGNAIWDKVYKLPGSNVTDLTTASILKTFDGGYFLWASGRYGLTKGNLAMRLNSVGDTLWTRKYSTFHDGSFITQSPDSGFIIGGFDANPFAISKFGKIDDSGSFLWAHSYGTGFMFTYMTALKLTHDGGCILTGWMHNINQTGNYPMPYLMRTNSLGDTLWTMAYDTLVFSNGSGSFQFINDVIETPEGGFMACGENLLLKTDSLGVPVWSYRYTFGNYSTVIKQIVATYDGGYLLSGIKEDSVYQSEIFLAKIDANGNSNCNYTAYTPPISHQNFWIGNMVFSPNNFPAVISTVSYTVSSGDSLVNINTLCTPVGIESINTKIALSVFPNPSDGLLTVRLPNAGNEDLSITLFDITGRIVFAKDFGKHGEQFNESIDLGNLFDGIYLMQVATSEHTFSKKVIVQHN